MGGGSLPMVGRILGRTQARTTTTRYAHLAGDSPRKTSERIASSFKETMES